MVNNRAIIGYSQKLYEFLRGSDSHELSEKAYVLKEPVTFGKKQDIEKGYILQKSY